MNDGHNSGSLTEQLEPLGGKYLTILRSETPLCICMRSARGEGEAGVAETIFRDIIPKKTENCEVRHPPVPSKT